MSCPYPPPSVLGQERPCLGLVGPSGGHVLPIHPVGESGSRYQRYKGYGTGARLVPKQVS